MVMVIEHSPESGLLGRLGAVAAGRWAAAVGQKVPQSPAQRVHPASGDSSPETSWDLSQACRSFDLADALEGGAGPGLASQYVEPRQTERRLLVKVSEDSRQHALMTDDGQKLLIARHSSSSSSGASIDIFISCGDKSQAEASVPDFVLRSDASKKRWSLRFARCECCEARGRRQCGTRELARMVHYSETVGDSEAFCMDVELPEYEQPSPGGRCCEVCGACPVERVLELSTRRPWWDAKNDTLRLSFHGRCNVSSERNFQLESPGSDRRTQAKLLFGERSHEMNENGKKLFVLDYSEPLGTVQAFAAALSTVDWA